jgi:hypothetical protein
MSSEFARHVYNAQVDAWVARAVAGGVNSYGRLLSTLPGVYPTQVLESLQRLRQVRKIGSAVVSQIVREARQRPPTLGPMREALLPPHPLDFEWRFSRNAGRALLARAADLAGTDGKILLLGTPTLAMLAAKDTRRGGYIYVGEDNDITQQILEASLKSPGTLDVRLCGPGALKAHEATVVVMDPPWYADFLRPMMRGAAFVCRPGGHVLVSLPPIGTNSHVADDRARFLRISASLSLNLRYLDAAVILYDTPYFEANALTADGYPNTPRAWRSGDLFVLEKAHDSRTIELVRTSRSREWHEIVINRMRLFVKKSAECADTEDVELTSVIPGDILPSVKRTDERRKLAQVWTSGNRIYATKRPDLVRIAGQIAASGGVLDQKIRLSTAERDAVVRLSYALGELAILEHSEERRGEFEEPACLLKRPKSRSVISSRMQRLTRSGTNT